MMFADIKKHTEVYMHQCINSFKKYINKVRTGRVSPDLLNDILIDYYGKLTPLQKLSNIVIEDSRTLSVTVYDHNILTTVEKMIMSSNLGLTPISNGTIIRVPIPVLTEERRICLIRTIRHEAEKARISLRSIRRFSNEKIKLLLKNKKINIDEKRIFASEIQILTDSWMKELDIILIKKEKELMNF